MSSSGNLDFFWWYQSYMYMPSCPVHLNGAVHLFEMAIYLKIAEIFYTIQLWFTICCLLFFVTLIFFYKCSTQIIWDVHVCWRNFGTEKWAYRQLSILKYFIFTVRCSVVVHFLVIPLLIISCDWGTNKSVILVGGLGVQTVVNKFI